MERELSGSSELRYAIAQSRCAVLRDLLAGVAAFMRAGITTFTPEEKQREAAGTDLEGILRELDLATAELQRAAAEITHGGHAIRN